MSSWRSAMMEWSNSICQGRLECSVVALRLPLWGSYMKCHCWHPRKPCGTSCQSWWYMLWLALIMTQWVFWVVSMAWHYARSKLNPGKTYHLMCWFQDLGCTTQSTYFLLSMSCQMAPTLSKSNGKPWPVRTQILSMTHVQQENHWVKIPISALRCPFLWGQVWRCPWRTIFHHLHTTRIPVMIVRFCAWLNTNVCDRIPAQDQVCPL